MGCQMGTERLRFNSEVPPVSAYREHSCGSNSSCGVLCKCKIATRSHPIIMGQPSDGCTRVTCSRVRTANGKAAEARSSQSIEKHHHEKDVGKHAGPSSVPACGHNVPIICGP